MKNSRLKRIVLVALGVFLLLSFLIIQFFKIQIIDRDKWSEIANKQHFFIIEEPFLRGGFWSNTELRKKHPEKPQRFVLEIQKFHLYADPNSIPVQNREKIADYLTEVLDLDAFGRSHLMKQLQKDSRSRKLALWLEQDVKDKIQNWWLDFSKHFKIPRNALYFIPQYQRSYPFGKLLGQVIHTVQAQRDELTHQAYPTGGLELYFDSYLSGKLGKRLLQRSPRHAFETGQILSPPENGADIYLTVNHYLQAIMEEELEIGVKRCGAKGGWAVMMDPYTGEIWGLAQYPFFNPAHYQDYFNDPEWMGHAKVKAITDAYEPGSVVKPFTVIAALLANQELASRGKPPLFDPESKMPCSDSRFRGRRKPLTDVRFHKYMNMNMAIQKSSNIYFARLVEKIIDQLGEHWYREVLCQRFGFGIPTGIELPSESAGMVPKPGKLNPNGTLEWSVPTPYSLSIGYNLLLTTMQITRAWCLLANGGTLVQPTLIKKIVKSTQDGVDAVAFDHDPKERAMEFPSTVPAEIVEQVVTALKYTTKPGGSGRRADVWGYSEVGKTGTAHKIFQGQYSETQYVTSFVGFSPVDAPVFVLMVVMNEPERKRSLGNHHHGSVSAAPTFKAIATRTLEYLGITPDDPHGYPPGDPRFNPQAAKWYPEAKQLQELYESWNK